MNEFWRLRVSSCVEAGYSPGAAPPTHRDRSDPLIAALALARAETLMDVAALGEIRAGREVVHSLVGDGRSFGLRVGASLPVKETYSGRLLEGRISNVVRDAQADLRVNDLRLTRQARIGAYIGVPVSTQDARLYVLSCLAHERCPRLCERDVLFMRGVAATIIAALHATSAADDEQPAGSAIRRSISARLGSDRTGQSTS